MLQRVIAQKGFWKSVAVLGLIYAFVLFFLQWALSGFPSEMFQLKVSSYLIFLLCGLVAGFFSAYGKFWAKVKRDDYRK